MFYIKCSALSRLCNRINLFISRQFAVVTGNKKAAQPLQKKVLNSFIFCIALSYKGSIIPLCV